MIPHSVDPLQGNDFIAEKFGANFDRWYRLFRRYFACHHPYNPVPPLTSHPNWKVDPFMLHFNNVFIQAAVQPEKFSTLTFSCFIYV